MKSAEQMSSISYNAVKFRSVTCKIHTHAHQAHHKYASASLLLELSPGNILNVTLCIFISLSLALRGGRATGSKSSSFHDKMEADSPYRRHLPPECDATKG